MYTNLNGFPLYKAFIRYYEKKYLLAALQYCDNKINRTAKFTGLAKATLIRKLIQLDIHPIRASKGLVKEDV